MITEKVFSGNGTAPPPEYAKALTFLLLIFALIMAGIVFSMHMPNMAGPLTGILLGGYYFIPKKRRPAKLLINKEADGEFYFIYKIEEDEKKFVINEYSYWYKKNSNEVKLIFKFVSANDKTIFITQIKTSVFNSSAWNENTDGVEYGAMRFEADDLELLALKFDKSNELVNK